LINLGYPTYVVDYGPISFSDRALGLEHWVEDVLPNAIRVVSEDAGGAPVQAVGWCLGGIMLLLASAGEPELPLASVALVASPFDFEQVRLFSPVRTLAKLTGGRLVTALYRGLGGAPAPLVSIGFRLTGIDRYLTRPMFLARKLHDRETIAHMEAVDAYMAGMLAYPGRTFGQLYHAFFRVNDLADGRIELDDGNVIDVANVNVPVLVVAGANDILAPPDAVHHVVDLLTGAPDVRAFTFKGGHLGVLTGRGARDTTWRHLDKFLRDYDHRRDAEQSPAPAAWLPTRAAR
jgi:polyhydroxyalkanoate synthase